MPRRRLRKARLAVSPLENRWVSRNQEFHRQAAGSHEIWHNPATNRYTTIPNHPGDMPEGAL